MSQHHHQVNGKNLFVTIVLNIIITVAQIVGGIFSGSLALLSDAMHNFSDVLSLLVAYIANRLSSKPHTLTKTFGYKRAEILAALLNSSMLVGIAIFLIIEAINKLYHPEIVNSLWVIALGVLSVVLNTISVLLIKDDAHGNMNMKAVYLHLATDVMTSIVVIVGGLLIYFFKIYWVDPLVSILIAIYLVLASFGIIKESIFVLMQFVPENVNIQDIVKLILKDTQINNIHHIHLWSLDDHSIHLEGHVDFKNNITLQESNKIIQKIEKLLFLEYHISHVTLQCEYDTHDNKDIIN